MFKGKELELKLSHITLAAQEWGVPGKPVLLATHGWLDNSNSFMPLVEFLNDYRVIAIDFPGHGFSQHRQTGYPLHLTDYVFDLEQVIEYLKQEYGIDKVNLLAHSFGGIISLLYASVFPQNVEKLIMLDILMPLFEMESNAKHRLQQSLIDHNAQANSDIKPKTYSSIETVAKVREKVTDLNYVNSKLIVSRNLRQTENGVVWRTDPKLKLTSAWRFSFQQVDSLIDHVEVPVFVIFGSRSKAQLQMNAFQIKFSSLVSEVVEGGHHIHMDNPKPVAEAVRSFIDQ
ncbi:alpha/beta hydrolase [Shewanella sp. 202IG2-18]|uniref:alpha/beta fold hydrolase n=1 Tax=Parashewanella hymeniacidonis TaxID=2807618 RepID=UPI0019618FA3|nr:alpha/beta hydrolase [Parashewanella hymeniacidonis]MBM7072705.1 alpha/beta hydrolase [Parashewanella hymeniacidonis]